MELYSAEAERIKKLISEWLASSDQELEMTFGLGGVDITTFLSVAKRLRARGFHATAQDDRMTISTPNHIRFTLLGLGTIQSYCQDDILAGKPFVAMIKDRTLPEANVDLDDYDTRIKVRRELGLANDDVKIKELFTTWKQERKAFRVIRRWSFESEGLVIDMSIVRSTQRDRSGNYKWQRSFKDQDVMVATPQYEIEVELKRVADDTVEAAMKRLIRGAGEVLRGIQKNTFLLRKSVKDKAVRGYKELTGLDKFRGVAPITLEMESFSKEREAGRPNIRDGYNVTDKADGLRVMAFCDGKGELFLFDMALNVYRTCLVNPACRYSLLDGEWISQSKHNTPLHQLLLFDIYIDVDKKDVGPLPFYNKETEECRYKKMAKWVTRWNDGTVVLPGVTAATKLQVVMKTFHFAEKGDSDIFIAAGRSLDGRSIYNTDGLIFTPNDKPLPEKAGVGFLEQFKWKPSEDNTIDFLVTFEKFTDSREDRLTVGVKPDTGETVAYKTLRLFVGSSVDAAYENPRDAVLEERGVGVARGKQAGKAEYRPVPFNPKEFPDTMASICYLEMHKDESTGEEYVITEKTEEPIQDKSIVEMRYDPSEPPGWRWKPLRVRMDKTERLQRGILGRTLNSDKVAESVWNSIHEPITATMIRTGNEQPAEHEIAALSKTVEGREAVARRYFERKAPAQDLLKVRGLRDFHNKWIKERILYKAGLHEPGKIVLDLAVGKAADLQRWRRAGVRFAFGTDIAGENITDPQNGAYRRYLDTVVRAGTREVVPPMMFVIADSSKRLVDGTAGATEQEKDILRSVFGKVRPAAAVPAFVEREGVGKLADGADCITVMFSLHYFFERKDIFDGFLRNVSDSLKVGGYFIGCCFDGDKVFELLRGVEKGLSKSGMDGDSLLWTITKQYSEDDIPEGDEAFGMGIDVEFISIGTEHREYLVPFRLLKAKMESIGCELMTPEECKAVGLQESTNLFGTSYEMAKKSAQNYPMTDAVKQFSFLNRWFVFRRKAEAVAFVEEEVALPGALEAPVAAPVPSASTAAAAAKNQPVTAAKAAVPVPGAELSVPGAELSVPGAEVPAAVAAQPPTAPTAATSEKKKIRFVTALKNGSPAPAAPSAVSTAAGQGVAAAPLRTLPVAPAEGAAPERPYSLNEIFQFYNRAALQDKLKIGDKGAGRWLAPSAPFPIEDPEDTSVVYPSLEHFIAGMMYKKATDKPELAVTLFSRDGSIHQQFLRQRLDESSGGRAIAEDRDYELLELETKEVKAAIRDSAMRRYGATFKPEVWATAKDEILRAGLKQRWTKDERMRKIITAVRAQNKILLYYTPGAANVNLGGVRRDDGKIEGNNKIGRILMEYANFPGF